jgi:hypothetical protein
MDGGLLVLGCLGHIIHMVVLYIPTYIGKILDTMWCYGNSVIWHVYIAISGQIAVEVKSGEANEARGHNTLHFKSAGELRVNANCP